MLVSVMMCASHLHVDQPHIVATVIGTRCYSLHVNMHAPVAMALQAHIGELPSNEVANRKPGRLTSLVLTAKR